LPEGSGKSIKQATQTKQPNKASGFWKGIIILGKRYSNTEGKTGTRAQLITSGDKLGDA
jgi:hypothetical protein